MADFTLIGRHTSVLRVTDNVAETCTIYNKTGSVITAGVLTEVTRGNAIIRHLDAGTEVDVQPGGSVVIDPTAVTGAVGVGFSDRGEAVTTTVVDNIVVTGVILTAEEKQAKKTKAKK